MKENQITASMAKDIAFKLGAVLNDEEAEIFADGYNAALLKVNKNASTELPNYANLSTSSQAAPDDSGLLPCPFCGSPAEHYPDGDMKVTSSCAVTKMETVTSRHLGSPLRRRQRRRGTLALPCSRVANL
ncbi:hypothetical protein KZK20_004059 [Salmonella enterica]|nr:hypothetical protein [Salmonella enterica subsp. enterica serovar Braenderup]EEQ0893419.1 hypothetical protein [Salmonella enterica subsp. enterica serovar Braenderup]EHU7156541.1 hypothetical protein [Salmonella enterica]HAC6862104.1 hypothetical protein [Salmonella enterica subsp. enterica serovar Braenderup]